MQKVGSIQAIWRFPVKGMAGESIQACYLGEGGLLGDRILAVQDVARKEIQSCKFRPGLLKCRANHSLDNTGAPTGEVDVTFPDGQVLAADNPSIHTKISDLIGHASKLQRLRPLEDDDGFYRRYKADSHTWLKELKATFERETGEPLPDLDNLPEVMQDYVSIPGTFFLVSPFHILTTASLQYMGQMNKKADWNIERFRPNLVIRTLPGVEGLIEQNWLDNRLYIGTTKIECTGTAPRCGAVIRAQKNLSDDQSILRSIVQNADQNLGIYGAISQTGIISVGDEVFLN